MKNFATIALGALGLAGLAQAHMEMIYPPPFKSKANPYAGQDIDYSMTSPLNADGSNFPCKGYLTLLNTKEGTPTATWEAGETYNMTITGGANHNGGSCQASLSFDKGKTWTVIKSYIGNCPVMGTSNLDFVLPSDTPSGEVVFAWSWFNNVGNREMYMNCAAVTVKGSSSKRDTAMSSRPAMFVANVNNGCSTKEGFDLMFPQPGPDVDDVSKNTSPPLGSCPGFNGGSASGSSGSGSGSAATSPAAVVSTPAAAAPTTQAAVSSAAATTSVAGGVFITVSQPAAGTSAAGTSTPAEGSSTLITITRSTGGDSSAPAVTPTPVASTPAAVSTPAAASPSSGSGSSSGGTTYTPGSACSDEGQWNCIDGKSFQRCASGQWSVVMAMAAGTTCSTGTTMNFAVLPGKRDRFSKRTIFRPRAAARLA